MQGDLGVGAVERLAAAVRLDVHRVARCDEGGEIGLEEEASMFLWLETVGEGWRVAEISEADLVTLLRDSCAGVRRIVHPFAANGVGKEPASVDREDFLRALSGVRSRQGEGAGRKSPPRVSAGKGRDFW